ncbi:MAG: hypothetical protein KGL39_14355 [Patescibacteria group bacterium]|nr:hypothetical protein [Patescibacteria group bacterium]
MHFKNSANLPSPLVRALTWRKQSYCDLSVTQLLKPPRILQLEKRHDDRIEIDVIDNVWSFFGSAMHYVLEKLADKENALAEEKLFLEIDGLKIGGIPDWYYRAGDGKFVLADLKTTSVWSMIFEPKGKHEWHKQTNIYAEMLRQHGFPVDRIEIWAILKDWKGSDKLKKPDYPKNSIAVIEIPLRPSEKVMSFIRERVRVHKAAVALGDIELPYCTPDEMWYRPGKLAVMKPGSSKAVKLFDEHEMEKASVFAETISGAWVEERNGIATRCESYCNVSRFCNQFQTELKKSEPRNV